MNIKPMFNTNEMVSLEDYMRSCGVADTKEYLNNQYVEPWQKYDNIIEMAQAINNAIKMRDKFYIITDSDFDGLGTALVQYLYLTKCDSTVDIKILMHNKNPKAHGFEDDEIMDWFRNESKEHIGTIWIGDAGSMNIKECKELSELGYTILISDHHLMSKSNDYAIVVNNQASEKVINKSLSGCGVTFKVCQAIDWLNNTNYSRDLISFVHITNISDSCGFTKTEQQTFRFWGLQMLYPTLLPFIEAFNYKGGTTNKDFSFGIVSRFNAVIRVGTLEQKQALFTALATGKNIDQAIDICKKCKTQQDKTRDSLLENNITIELDSNIVVGKIDTKTPLTGLIANKLLSKYNKPIFLVHERKNGTVEGSCRSTVDLKELCSQSKVFNYAEGHECSFGISWQKENEPKVYEWIASLTLSEPHIDVLQSHTINSLPKYLFNEFGLNKGLYGQDMKDPLIHIHDITINSNDISVMGANGRTIKITKNGIDFMWFIIANADKEKLLNTPYTLEVVGTMGINEWNGVRTPQIIVENFEITESKQKTVDDIF